MTEDLEHLRILAICHYVVGGLAAVGACLPCIHLGVGIAIVTGAFDQPGSAPPAFMGWLFIVLAVAFILFGWAFAVAMVVAGRLLQNRQGYLFCFVMACIVCTFAPLGTVLGIFTIFVLLRPTVKELFGRDGSGAAAEPAGGV